MPLDKANLGTKNNIYKYTASMKYILGDKVIDIESMHMRSIAIDSNYKNMNMPMIFVTAMVPEDIQWLIEENQTYGKFILNIKRSIANSNMSSIFLDYIEDEFIYFMARDHSGKSNHEKNENREANFEDTNRDELYRLISLGLLSINHINKNKKVMNGVVSGDLSSIMYYITGHLPIVIEPPDNNVRLENQFLPPMNSVAKSLEYINSLSTFYETPYRFFIDFDFSYLLSSSGNAVKRKGETISTVLISLRDDEKDTSAEDSGVYINKEKKIYQIDVRDSDCEIADNHISGKSYSKLAATGTSGNTFSKSVADLSKSDIIDKIRTVRIMNDNVGLLDNMVASANSSSIQLQIQKMDVDSSIFSPNKEYILESGDVYDRAKYNGTYLLTRKRELYIKLDGDFTVDVMLLFEKLHD